MRCPVQSAFEQIAARAERGREHVQCSLDAQLADNEFICGADFASADITGLVTLDSAGWAKLKPPDQLSHSRNFGQKCVANTTEPSPQP